eukprot:1842869-Rhodomonas_salina.1
MSVGRRDAMSTSPSGVDRMLSTESPNANALHLTPGRRKIGSIQSRFGGAEVWMSADALRMSLR